MGVHSPTLRIVGHLAIKFLKTFSGRLRIIGTGLQVKEKGVKRVRGCE